MEKMQQIFHLQFYSYIAVNLQLECILQVVLHKIAENNKHLVFPARSLSTHRHKMNNFSTESKKKKKRNINFKLRSVRKLRVSGVYGI